MATTQIALPIPRKPLRLWPGIIAVVLQWVGWFLVPVVLPLSQAPFIGLLAGLLGGLAILVWWLLFSRAPWLERIGAPVLIVVALILTKRVVHASIAGGAMGMLLYVLAIPVFGLALVAWAVLTRRFSTGARRLALLATILLGCSVFMLIRTGGLTAEFDNDFHWRWSKTPEQRLLAQASDETPASAPAPATANADNGWSGFRGPQRDGTVHGVKIKTDWSATPPVVLWRRPVGPAWSSFAVQGGRLYTQEQLGEEEIVVCHDLSTGKPVWKHSDRARFWESNAGAGPRATPTLNNGRVYTQGATGIVNALDAATGAVVWTRNSVADTGTKVPGWGIAGSPLVVNDLVIAAASGSLVAYDLATGNQRWLGPTGGSGYSSPQLVTINGVQQVVLLNSNGAIGVSLADGKLLWEHKWEGVPIVQPGVAPNGDLLVSVSESSGLRRLAVAQTSGAWTVQERWTSEDIYPWFNDFVVHKGHAFGFNGSSLVCINLEDGKLKWKGKRYGYGQVILLPEQDLLLILSEQGELALAKATPDQFTELAHFPALEGKTWNHPVLVGNVLLVRNDHEMAAFRLSSEGS
ncbi:MAG TPA: PQQ-binding-like beta-propeller repeat protein [Pyrinomonadaceae bacterium]|nr:PQQ-binding-like beta-propeller repeat protein [Pyrinomonadaceae bacterium]